MRDDASIATKAVSLYSAAVTTAGTAVGDWYSDFTGAKSATFQAALIYGSGGTSCKIYVQTTLDDGATATDIACFAFTTSSARRLVNVTTNNAGTALVTPSDGALTDNTAVDAILGRKLRVKIISTGTYSGSTVNVYANVRG